MPVDSTREGGWAERDSVCKFVSNQINQPEFQSWGFCLQAELGSIKPQRHYCSEADNHQQNFFTVDKTTRDENMITDLAFNYLVTIRAYRILAGKGQEKRSVYD